MSTEPGFPQASLSLDFNTEKGTRSYLGFSQLKQTPFFTMRVVKHWPKLPREAVAASSLAVFKARLDGALSNLV